MYFINIIHKHYVLKDTDHRQRFYMLKTIDRDILIINDNRVKISANVDRFGLPIATELIF